MNKTLLSAWIPVILWAGVIFMFSSQPTIPTPFVIWWDFVIKKTAHITEFAILFTLLFRAMKLSISHMPTTKIKTIAFIVALLYAASDEFHQRFTPGRTSTLRDVGIDLIGITLALWLVSKLDIIKVKYPKLIHFINLE